MSSSNCNSINWEKLRKQALIRDNYKCQICGDYPCFTKEKIWLDVHHKIPTECGGTDTLDNLITVCRNYCHRAVEICSCDKDYTKQRLKEIGKTPEWFYMRLIELNMSGSPYWQRKINYPIPNKQDINTNKLKKITAHDLLTIRPAAGNREEPSLIVSIPKSIAKQMSLKLRDRVRIYTDDEKIYIDKYEEPQL